MDRDSLLAIYTEDSTDLETNYQLARSYYLEALVFFDSMDFNAEFEDLLSSQAQFLEILEEVLIYVDRPLKTDYKTENALVMKGYAYATACCNVTPYEAVRDSLISIGSDHNIIRFHDMIGTPHVETFEIAED